MATRTAISREARWFRFAAIAEAITWLGLLVGMAVKYLGSGSETGVQIFGMAHGVIVLVYFAVTLFAATRLRWGSKTLVLALLASVPPGFTLVFEAWAERTGKLHRRASRPAATPAAHRRAVLRHETHAKCERPVRISALSCTGLSAVAGLSSR